MFRREYVKSGKVIRRYMSKFMLSSFICIANGGGKFLFVYKISCSADI